MRNKTATLATAMALGIVGIGVGYCVGLLLNHRSPVGMSQKEASQLFFERRDAHGKRRITWLGNHPKNFVPPASRILAQGGKAAKKPNRALASTGTGRIIQVNGVSTAVIDLKFICSGWLYRLFGIQGEDPSARNRFTCDDLAHMATLDSQKTFTNTDLPVQFSYTSVVEAEGWPALLGTDGRDAATRIAAANAGRMPGFLVTGMNFSTERTKVVTNPRIGNTLCLTAPYRDSTTLVPSICFEGDSSSSPCDDQGNFVWDGCNTSVGKSDCKVIPNGMAGQGTCALPCYCRYSGISYGGNTLSPFCGTVTNPFDRVANICGYTVLYTGDSWPTTYNTQVDLSYQAAQVWLKNVHPELIPAIGDWSITTTIRPEGDGITAGLVYRLYDVKSKIVGFGTARETDVTPDNYFNRNGLIAINAVDMGAFAHEVGHVLGALHNRDAWKRENTNFYHLAGFDSRPAGAVKLSTDASGLERWTKMASPNTALFDTIPAYSSPKQLALGKNGDNLNDNRTRIGETLNFLAGQTLVRPTVSPSQGMEDIINAVFQFGP